MKLLYAFTITLSAFLLFSVEPMIARALLPQLGGSSAVWIGALAFFQIALLIGYGYAVVISPASTRSPGRWATHLALLALAAASLLPSIHVAGAHPGQSPQLRLFWLLTTSAGLPFTVLSTTAPLLQAWYARREQTAVPYRLFGLSNLASLLALLAYPTLIEPHLALGTQFLVWKGAFGVSLLLAATLTLRMRSATPSSLPEAPSSAAPGVGSRTRFLWLSLPAVASLQLAAVTAHLTQDVASMPLLWVLPLAVYLLSFVLAFEFPRLYHRTFTLRMLAVLLFALGYFLTLTGFNVPIGISIVFFLGELLFASWFCHAELFALRPQADASRPASETASSVYYLHVAAGGAAGTLAVAILSPALTRSNFDLPVAFLVTALLILFVTWRQGAGARLLWGAGTVFTLYVLGVVHGAATEDTLFRERNFYGSLRVKQSLAPPQAYISRTLFNGAIQHGMQWFSTDFHHEPLTYYARESGVGLAFENCCEPTHPRRIGVIGLGAGTLAAYGRPGDQIRFYEINPVVTDVAQHLFTYTRDTPAAVTVVPGDARLSLAAEPPQRFDVLVIDAFSGDSIPVHLLTREALSLYERHLAPGGILAFHISNQYLDLAPVLARLAESTQSSGTALTARRFDSGPHSERGEFLASWVLLSRRPNLFTQPALATAGQPIATEPRVHLWTDGYSSLLPILRWTGRH